MEMRNHVFRFFLSLVMFLLVVGTAPLVPIGQAVGNNAFISVLHFLPNTAAAEATTAIVVNSLADTSGPCSSTGTGTCTLRDAIDYANAQDFFTTTTITFGVSGTIPLGSTLPAINRRITIDGHHAITVSGQNSVGVIVVNNFAFARLWLHNITIADGFAGFGGGIRSDGGEVNVVNCTFSGNTADESFSGGASGGAIYYQGGGQRLNVIQSTFTRNSANSSIGSGGAIFSSAEGTGANVINSTFTGNLASAGGAIGNFGTLNVTNSTFTGNSATGQSDAGGAIANLVNANNAGTLYVINSTFNGNTSQGEAGGVSSKGSTTITNSTFSGNSASTNGGALTHNPEDSSKILRVTSSTFSGNSAANGGAIYATENAIITNSILANSPSGGNCVSSSNLDALFSLADDGTCSAATQVTSAQLNLQTLADNGGPTQTMALGVGSLAIDAGHEGSCAGPPVNGLDQRGVLRPIDGDGDGIARCEVGAYESSGPAAPPTPTPTPTPQPTATPTPVPTPTPTPVPTPTPTPTACVKEGQCFRFEYLGYVVDTTTGRTSVSFRVTNKCSSTLSYVAIGTDGFTRVAPTGGNVYTGILGPYDVVWTGTTGNPGFLSIKFAPAFRTFNNFASDVFTITVETFSANTTIQVQGKASGNQETYSFLLSQTSCP